MSYFADAKPLPPDAKNPNGHSVWCNCHSCLAPVCMCGECLALRSIWLVGRVQLAEALFGWMGSEGES